MVRYRLGSLIVVFLLIIIMLVPMAIFEFIILKLKVLFFFTGCFFAGDTSLLSFGFGNIEFFEIRIPVFFLFRFFPLIGFVINFCIIVIIITRFTFGCYSLSTF